MDDFEYEHFYEQNGQTEPRKDFVGYENAVAEYRKAKRKVLFEGFEVRTKGEFGVAIVNKEGVRLDWRFRKNRFFQGYYTIEDLTGLGLKYKGI